MVIYVINRYLLSTSLPSTLVKHREVNVNMTQLVLSGGSLTTFSRTTEGGKGNNVEVVSPKVNRGTPGGRE